MACRSETLPRRQVPPWSSPAMRLMAVPSMPDRTTSTTPDCRPSDTSALRESTTTGGLVGVPRVRAGRGGAALWTGDSHTATIDWGDGTVEAGAVTQAANTGSVVGSHPYADDGTFTVTVTVTDDDGASTSDNLTVTVNNVPPTIAVSGAAGVDEGSPYTLTLAGHGPASTW